MKITKQNLLDHGFVEHINDCGSFYVKGNIALVYNFNAWIPCHYVGGTLLADRLYLENMEEIELLNR